MKLKTSALYVVAIFVFASLLPGARVLTAGPTPTPRPTIVPKTKPASIPAPTASKKKLVVPVSPVPKMDNTKVDRRPSPTPQTFRTKMPTPTATPQSFRTKMPTPTPTPQSFLTKMPTPTPTPQSFLTKMPTPTPTPQSFLIKKPIPTPSPQARISARAIGGMTAMPNCATKTAGRVSVWLSVYNIR